MPDSAVVLEPDALQRDIIQLALKRVGLETIACARSGDLLNLLLERRPSLLILDLYLAERNGLDLLEEMRQTGLLVTTRVIVVSALTFPEIVMRANRLGVAAFLAKPIDSDSLVDRVMSILNTRGK
jgi:DNA-binding response OmpR family regulator